MIGTVVLLGCIAAAGYLAAGLIARHEESRLRYEAQIEREERIRERAQALRMLEQYESYPREWE